MRGLVSRVSLQLPPPVVQLPSAAQKGERLGSGAMGKASHVDVTWTSWGPHADLTWTSYGHVDLWGPHVDIMWTPSGYVDLMWSRGLNVPLMWTSFSHMPLM